MEIDQFGAHDCNSIRGRGWRTHTAAAPARCRGRRRSGRRPHPAPWAPGPHRGGGIGMGDPAWDSGTFLVPSFGLIESRRSGEERGGGLAPGRLLELDPHSPGTQILVHREPYWVREQPSRRMDGSGANGLGKPK